MSGDRGPGDDPAATSAARTRPAGDGGSGSAGGGDGTGSAGGGGTGAAGPDAVEQLQRAVLTMIGATRVVLDALEAVVADRRRLEQLASSGRAALGPLGSLSSLCSALLGQRPRPGDGGSAASGEDGGSASSDTDRPAGAG